MRFCRNLCLFNNPPITAVAAFFEASNYLAEVGLSAAFADEAVLDVHDKMHVFGHHHVVLNLYDGIVEGNTMEQFVFYHLSNGCQFHSGGIRMTVGIVYVSNDSS